MAFFIKQSYYLREIGYFDESLIRAPGGPYKGFIAKEPIFYSKVAYIYNDNDNDNDNSLYL